MEPLYWLNDDSRAFLAKDYLRHGVTPEQRIRQIAEYAEKLLDYSGFADRFERYMHAGWFSLASPIWSNFGTGRGLSISCVVGDTWINTRQGGKLAKEIIAGDEVLTHRGRFRRVTEVLVTPCRSDLYELKVSTRMTPIRLTGDHRVLTNLGWIRADQLDCARHLVAVNRQIDDLPEVAHSIDLRSFCHYDSQVSPEGLIQRVMTPKNQRKLGRIVSRSFTEIRAIVPVDLDLAWAIGLWFAEGSIAFNTSGGVRWPSGIRITLNMDERQHADRWLSIIQKAFNTSGTITEGICHRPDAPVSKVSRWLNVTVNSCVLGSLFASFGNGCKEKMLPDWALTLPKPILAQLLEGVLLGDGSAYPEKETNRLTLANPQLILQVYQIGLRLGREMSLQMQDKPSRYGKTKHVYTIIFRKDLLGRRRHGGQSAVPFHDGLSYSPIRSIKPIELTTTVYDFTVDDDHSFSAAGVVLHNCNGSYVPDTMTGILEKVAEVGMMTKLGAGTSAYFGDVRPRGVSISTGGKSSGPVHFMELFEALTSVVSQSSMRRGSFAAYLPVEHPDIEEFLQIRDEGHAIRQMSLGICISDAWMESMLAGDKAKRAIWARIIEKRKKGYPYLFFTDTVNRHAPQVYKDKGMRIHASNLCVIGDTLVEVAAEGEELVTLRIQDLGFYMRGRGPVRIKSYDTKRQEVVMSEITAFAQTGESTDLMEIEDESGRVLFCTPEHKVYTKNRGYVEAQFLTETDALVIN